MISFDFHQQPAEYDEDGNIILPSDSAGDDAATKNTPAWTVTEEDDVPLQAVEQRSERVSRHQHASALPHGELWKNTASQDISKDARNGMFSVMKQVFDEGAQQYSFSASNCRQQCRSLLQSAAKSRRPLWNFLTQPVWIVNRKNKEMKQYNRLTLFLFDTLRFGGTFAAIFLFLFVTLNYQSFWEITQSYVNPIRRVQQSINSGSNDDALKQKLLKSPSLAVAGSSKGELLNFLPPVGPPENRIIIPKLNLNVPLITPSYQSLMNENWDQLEQDIQDALKMGVVHYPGTARPGQAGNFFVTGHSSYYPWAPGNYKTVFARLHDLDVGDEYWVYYGGDKHRYVIQEKKEVKPTNVNVLDQPVGKRMSTLMTCTPVGTTLRRLILTAVEVDPVTGNPMEVGESESRPQQDLKVNALPI